MPTNTPLRRLPYPVEGDSPDVPRDIEALATALDTNPVVTSAALGSIPSTAELGSEFYATDAKRWYKWNGTEWDPMMIAGAWTALTSVPAGTTTDAPAARLVGDKIELKGGVDQITAASASNPILGVLPVGFRPAKGRMISIPYHKAPSTYTVIWAYVDTSGNIGIQGGYTWVTNDSFYFDDVKFPL